MGAPLTIHRQPMLRVCALEGCNEVFTPHASKVARGAGRYHSLKCAYEARRGRVPPQLQGCTRKPAPVLDGATIDRYRGGVRAVDLARELGIAPRTFYCRLKAAGIAGGRRLGAIDDATLRRYFAGEPVRALAGELGISSSTFYRLLNRNGMRARCHRSLPF